MTGPAHIFDKPNRYIGQPSPRVDAARLLQGRGRFVDDETLPRMVHAAFVRSPHAHAKILKIETANAKSAPGVIAIYTGDDLAEHVTKTSGLIRELGKDGTPEGRRQVGGRRKNEEGRNEGWKKEQENNKGRKGAMDNDRGRTKQETKET